MDGNRKVIHLACDREWSNNKHNWWRKHFHRNEFVFSIRLPPFHSSLSARITLNIRKWCMQSVLFAFYRNLISFREWWRNHCRWRKLNYALWKVKKRIPSAFQNAFGATEWSVLREMSRVSRLETNFYLIYRFQTQHFIECRLKASTTMPATKGTESS